MKVHRDELLKAIETVRPATANIEDMSNLYFSGKDIVAFNNKTCLHSPFESDFSFLVNGKLIDDFVSRVDTEEIVMALKENKLIMKAKGMKATLTTVLESEIVDRTNAIKKEFDALEWYALPDDFIKGAFLCMFSASKDPASGTLTCLHVDGKYLVTGDNRRVSLYTMKEELDGFMIEALIASELKKLEEVNLSMYSMSDSWVHFANEEGTTLSIRRIMGEYPDFRTMMNKSIKEAKVGAKFKLPEGIKEVVETASLTVEGYGVSVSHSVAIELSKNKIKCVGISDTKGTIEKTSKIIYDGGDISFSISPTFLLGVLNKATTVTISENKQQAVFRSGGFKHLMVLPIP